MANYSIDCVICTDDVTLPVLKCLNIKNIYGYNAMSLDEYYQNSVRYPYKSYQDCFDDIMTIKAKYKIWISIKQYPENQNNFGRRGYFKPDVCSSKEFVDTIIDFCKKNEIGYHLTTLNDEVDKLTMEWDKSLVFRIAKYVSDAMKRYMPAVIENVNDPDYDIEHSIDMIVDKVMHDIKIRNNDRYMALSIARATTYIMIKNKENEIDIEQRCIDGIQKCVDESTNYGVSKGLDRETAQAISMRIMEEINKAIVIDIDDIFNNSGITDTVNNTHAAVNKIVYELSVYGVDKNISENMAQIIYDAVTNTTAQRMTQGMCHHIPIMDMSQDQVIE